jgi:hypothetical protein
VEIKKQIFRSVTETDQRAKKEGNDSIKEEKILKGEEFGSISSINLPKI